MAYLGLEPTPACLLPQIQEIEARTRKLTAGLVPSAMTWRPPDGGWSVAQVLEHLVISNRLYFPAMRSLLEQATTPPQAATRPWKPSFMGGLLIRSLRPQNKRKLPTTKRLKPGPEPRANVVAEFLDGLRMLEDFVRQAQGRDMTGPRMTSTVNALVRRLNLGDALIILVVHAQRHLDQVERVKASPGFPRNAAQPIPEPS